MKKLAIIFIGLFLMTFAFQSVNAQSTANASSDAGATIVAPITIDNEQGLLFGEIVKGSVDGSVLITPDNTNVTATGIMM